MTGTLGATLMETIAANLGLVVSLIFTLMILSGLFGDSVLSRLAHYLLVGLAFGYMGVLTLQHFLRPYLWLPIRYEVANGWEWLGLGLGLTLLITGVMRLSQQGRLNTHPEATWRWWLSQLGLIPLGILAGVGVTVALLGAIQGTIAPQFWRLASNGLDWNAPLETLVAGLLTLLLSVGVLFHLTLDPVRHLNKQPIGVRQLILTWIWVGQRALWLAAGVFFARLFAARLTLLVSLIEWFLRVLGLN